MSLLVCLASFFYSETNSTDKWSQAAKLNAICFSYVALICCSAIATGALNSHGRFFLPSGFSPIILNLSMIATLFYFGVWQNRSLEELAIFLSFSILIMNPTIYSSCRRIKKKISMEMSIGPKGSEELSKMNQIFWIGALGAAVIQVNILVSRFLAFSLDENGSHYLFLSARLIELPLGVFAISISTVMFPELSKASSSHNKSLFSNYLYRGFRVTSAIILPAAFGFGYVGWTNFVGLI